MSRASARGGRGAVRTAGLGRRVCGQRVRRASGRTLHGSEAIAEIRCAFWALSRATRLPVAALRRPHPAPAPALLASELARDEHRGWERDGAAASNPRACTVPKRNSADAPEVASSAGAGAGCGRGGPLRATRSNARTQRTHSGSPQSPRCHAVFAQMPDVPAARTPRGQGPEADSTPPAPSGSPRRRRPSPRTTERQRRHLTHG